MVYTTPDLISSSQHQRYGMFRSLVPFISFDNQRYGVYEVAIVLIHFDCHLSVCFNLRHL